MCIECLLEADELQLEELLLVEVFHDEVQNEIVVMKAARKVVHGHVALDEHLLASFDLLNENQFVRLDTLEYGFDVDRALEEFERDKHAQPADLLVEVVFLKLRHHLGLLEVLIVFEKEFLEFLLTFAVDSIVFLI